MTDDVKTGPGRPRLAARRVARTEAELMDAAHDLFLEQGYVSTTLAQVAQRAGLAARTVYVRFGTKAALFERVVDRALVGDAEPIDVAHRPGTIEAMTADTLQARIHALADVCVGVAERAGPLFEVAAQAEAVEPDVAAAAQCRPPGDAGPVRGVLAARQPRTSFSRTTSTRRRSPWSLTSSSAPTRPSISDARRNGQQPHIERSSSAP